MSCVRSWLIVGVVALFSFLGGVVGGWLAQTGVVPARANEVVVRKNADFNAISANRVIAGELLVRKVSVVDMEWKPVGSLYGNDVGGTTFDFGVQRGDSFKTVASIGTGVGGSYFSMLDNGSRNSFSVKIVDGEPLMGFYYNGKKRLGLGTNSIVTKLTGDTHQIKGSVYIYDAQGDVTHNMPIK